MQWHDFMWRGKLASSMGVVVETQAEYIRPAERVESVTVPGRSGTLHLLGGGTGGGVYEDVVYTLQCYLRPGADRNAVAEWLRGSGRLVLGSMPDYAYDARLINQIPWAHVFEGSGADDWVQLAPVFDCQPYRYQAVPAPCITITLANAGPSALTNPGNVPSEPVIAVHMSGSAALTVGGSAFVLNNVDGYIIIDTPMMDCFSADRSTLFSSKMDGDYPLIGTGTTGVGWTLPDDASSITDIVIDPRWRWI